MSTAYGLASTVTEQKLEIDKETKPSSVKLQRIEELEKELVVYNAILKDKPNDADALYKCGTALYELCKLGKYDEWLPSHRLYFRDSEERINYKLGEMIARYKRALRNFDASLEVRPKHADTLTARGIVLYTLERYREAFYSFDASLKVRPKHADTLTSCGQVLCALGLYRLALDNFDASLEVRPKHADTLRQRGYALRGLMRLKEALESYEASLKVRPDDDITLEESKEVFENSEFLLKVLKGAEAIPMDVESIRGRGIALLGTGQYDEALKCFEAFLKANPEKGKAAALLFRGHALRALGQEQEALESYKAAGNEYRDRKKKYQKALKCYVFALELSPYDVDIISNCGAMFYYLKCYEKALESYDTALMFMPKHTDALAGHKLTLHALKQPPPQLEVLWGHTILPPLYSPYIRDLENTILPPLVYSPYIKKLNSEIKSLTKQVQTNSIYEIDISAIGIPLPICNSTHQELRPLFVTDIIELLEALATNTSVTTLNLSSNIAIDDKVIEPLMTIYTPSVFFLRKPNSTLVTIDLRDTKITPRGLEKLDAAIQKQKLKVKLLCNFETPPQKRTKDLEEKARIVAEQKKSAEQAAREEKQRQEQLQREKEAQELQERERLKREQEQKAQIERERQFQENLHKEQELKSAREQKERQATEEKEKEAKAKAEQERLRREQEEKLRQAAELSKLVRTRITEGQTYVTELQRQQQLQRQTEEQQEKEEKLKSTLGPIDHPELNYRHRPLTEENLMGLALVIKSDSEVKSLCLGENSLGEKGAILLAEALAANNTLTNLDIQKCTLKKEGVVKLFRMLGTNKGLKSFKLESKAIDSEALKVLAETLATNDTLEEIYLSGSELGEKEQPLLAKITTKLKKNQARAAQEQKPLVQVTSVDEVLEQQAVEEKESKLIRVMPSTVTTTASSVLSITTSSSVLETKTLPLVMEPELAAYTHAIIQSQLHFLCKLQEQALQDEKITSQIQTIHADGARSDYYHTFICQFRGYWLACNAIYSGKLEDIEKTKGLYLARVVNEIGKHFPGVSMITDIIELSATAYSERDKKERVNSLVSFFTTIEEADRVIEGVARSLTLSLTKELANIKDYPKTGKIDQAISCAKKVKAWVLAEAVDSAIKELAAKHCLNILTAIMEGKITWSARGHDIEALVKIALSLSSVILAVPKPQLQVDPATSSSSSVTATPKASVRLFLESEPKLIPVTGGPLKGALSFNTPRETLTADSSAGLAEIALIKKQMQAQQEQIQEQQERLKIAEAKAAKVKELEERLQEAGEVMDNLKAQLEDEIDVSRKLRDRLNVLEKARGAEDYHGHVIDSDSMLQLKVDVTTATPKGMSEALCELRKENAELREQVSMLTEVVASYLPLSPFAGPKDSEPGIRVLLDADKPRQKRCLLKVGASTSTGLSSATSLTFFTSTERRREAPSTSASAPTLSTTDSLSQSQPSTGSALSPTNK